MGLFKISKRVVQHQNMRACTLEYRAVLISPLLPSAPGDQFVLMGLMTVNAKPILLGWKLICLSDLTRNVSLARWSSLTLTALWSEWLVTFSLNHSFDRPSDPCDSW